MLQRTMFGLSVLLFSLAFHPAAVSAQSTDASAMSAEELEQVFKKQKTRGLVLVPTNQEGAAGNTADAAPQSAASTYVELNPEEQVNIQISFDFDSAALREDQKSKLGTLCEVMKGSDLGNFRIIGHTDASGSAGYNEKLSLLRAQEVKRYLTGDCGIAAERLDAVGVGEAYPLDKQDPRGDVNRRVEFQALS